MALGQDVRHKKHYADAVAVAAETMRRVRHNVELLIQRLSQMGYRFVAPSLEDDLEEWRQAMNPRSTGRVARAVWAGLAGSAKDNKARREKLAKARAQMEGIVLARCAALEAKLAVASKNSPLDNPDVFCPPGREVAAQLNKLENLTGGCMPISLRAWYEQVGAVSLVGAHEVLNPRGCEIADPLVVYPLDPALTAESVEDAVDDGGRLEYYIAASDRTKANLLGGGFYSIMIPNASADAPLENEWRHTTFVDYLRRVFEWGGFPGWERDANPPRDLIARLTEGLLSL